MTFVKKIVVVYGQFKDIFIRSFPTLLTDIYIEKNMKIKHNTKATHGREINRYGDSSLFAHTNNCAQQALAVLHNWGLRTFNTVGCRQRLAPFALPIIKLATHKKYEKEYKNRITRRYCSSIGPYRRWRDETCSHGIRFWLSLFLTNPSISAKQQTQYQSNLHTKPITRLVRYWMDCGISLGNNKRKII
jgi:hypothetical protein